MHANAATDSVQSNLDAIRDGCSFRNPGYDFFMGQSGRKRGLLGYCLNKKLDVNLSGNNHAVQGVPNRGPPGEAYSGKRWVPSVGFRAGTVEGTDYGVSLTAPYPTMERALTVDDLMTIRVNKDDYVVMKDVRFFLGKEHGKSHFEDHLHWDWNDPIDTANDNVLSSETLNGKNYRWYMTLIGTNGGHNPVVLNCHHRWTTKMESG
jgi:hypothetical protein